MGFFILGQATEILLGWEGVALLYIEALLGFYLSQLKKYKKSIVHMQVEKNIFVYLNYSNTYRQF